MSFAFSTATRFSAFVALVAALGAHGLAATTIYTTAPAFAANLQPGSYTETFSAPANATLTASFSGGDFAYTVSAPTPRGFNDDVYQSGAFVGNYYSNNALTVTFTSGAPTAVGGNFFITDLSDAFVVALVTVTLADGTTSTFTPTSASAGSFRGFTSSVPIASLTLSSPGSSRFNSIDNLTVGLAVVPEPTTLGLASLASLALARRRRI